MTESTDVTLPLAVVESNLDKEKKDRETADQTLQSNIDSLETALDLKENKSDTFTYMVSVEDDKYLMDGESQPSLDLFNGNTYIFDMSSSIPENFIKFSTTPNGPIEYTEGVTSTEVIGKVETLGTFSSLLFNGVDECLEKLPLKNTNDFVQLPDIINKHNRLFHRFPPSISFVDRQLYFVSFQKYNSNSEYKILQSKLNTANDIINYSNGTFGVWEKITIVEKENGFYSLKNANNKYIRNLQYFNTNKGGSLDLNVITFVQGK